MRKNILRGWGTNVTLFGVLIILLLTSILITNVSALNATGSQYTISKFSTTVASAPGNGTEYVGSSSDNAEVVTNDAQGLTYGAVVGISGNAVLTPNKIPIINSYSVTSSVNKSSSVRLFLSAVYTSKTSVDITRPNGVTDNVNMMSQSVYYYPYTDLVGRYAVRFIAEGNGVVTADTYFDVVESYVAPPVITPVSRGGSSGGGSSYIAPTNEMYVSVAIYCVDTATIVVKITNDTSPLYGALVLLNSSNVSMNSSTDKKGSITFNVESGNYTISAYASGYTSIVHDYEAYCGVSNKDNAITGDVVSNNSVPNTSGNSVVESSGNSVSTALVETSQKSLSLSMTSLIISGVMAVVSSLMLFIVLVMLLHNSRHKTPDESFVFNAPVGPIFYSDKPKPTSGFGVYSPNKGPSKTITQQPKPTQIVKNTELTPVEQAMIDADKEAWNTKTEDLDTPSKDKKKEKKELNIIKIEPKKVEESKKETPVIPIEKPKITPIEIKPTILTATTPVAPVTPTIISLPLTQKTVTPDVQKTTKEIKKAIDVPEGKEFILCSGEHIFNLPDLLMELRYMSDDVFNYHVNDYKNDFAAWIYHVVGDKELANNLGPIKSKKEIIDLIKKKLNN